MGIVRALSLLAASFVLVSVFGVSNVLAQYSGWAPPTNLPPTGNVSPVVNVGTTAQVKKGALGIDLSGTLASIPVGSGLYIKAGSLFVEYSGTSALSTWIADSAYAISTSGRIRAHGITSSADLQSDLLKIAGETGERAVCADNSTGKLKICGVTLGPSVTFTASPTAITATTDVTLTWSATNAVSCTGVNFSTGTGSPISGTKIVTQAAKSVGYIVTCVDSFGQSVSKSASVTYTAPATVIPTVSVSASGTSIASGSTTTISWTSTNANSCAAIPPSPSAFNTSNATAGSSSFQLTNNTANATTVTFAVRCTSTTNNTIDGSVVVTINPAAAPAVTLTANPASLSSGSQLTTLTWSSTNATSCTGSGGSFSTSNLTSGSSTVSQSATTTYTVTCTSSVTGLTGTKSVTVTTAAALPVITFTVAGQSTSTFELSLVASPLAWSATNATTCTGTNFTTNGLTSGTVSVNPTLPTIYTIVCTGVGGSATKSISAIDAGPPFTLYNDTFKWNGSAWAWNPGGVYMSWGWNTSTLARFDTWRQYHRFGVIDVLPAASNVECRSRVTGTSLGYIDSSASTPGYITGLNKLNGQASGVWTAWRPYTTLSDMNSSILGTCATAPYGCPMTDLKMAPGTVGQSVSVECRHTLNGVVKTRTAPATTIYIMD